MVPLARDDCGGAQFLLLMLPMPAHLSLQTSTITSHPAPNYHSTGQAGRHGSHRATAKFCLGYEYILELEDHATCYPETVLLKRTTSKNIMRKLVLLFSQVSIPKDILSDQGTPFISQVLQDLCQLLQMKHVHSSVYHPQTDGLDLIRL